ncbi:arginine decarboxylase, pyruvoyl-dependent [Candidatus Micrarchaeota archaeon]|nr:arginine decarboxylase, pyruvoyl-dependent [Candidatus Micrarchaeota archaeon]
MNHVPNKMFFTSGVGKHREKLQSFELALRDAGIEKYNLVHVSSIYPPGCKIVPMNVGIELLMPGEITYVVMARNDSNEPNRLVAASVGVAIPADEKQYGYLSEHHSYGETEQKAGDYAEELAGSMLASTLGIEFEAGQTWDEKERIFKISGQIVRTSNVTKSAVCDKNGLWTSVVAAAVLVLGDNDKKDVNEKTGNEK